MVSWRVSRDPRERQTTHFEPKLSRESAGSGGQGALNVLILRVSLSVTAFSPLVTISEEIQTSLRIFALQPHEARNPTL